MVRERLHLDREKIDREKRHRMDALRCEEREARDKSELEKFKLIMDTIASTRKYLCYGNDKHDIYLCLYISR